MIEEFRDDDDGYLDWVAANPGGHVINIQRSLNPSDARVHRACCGLVTGNHTSGRTWTGQHIKVCAVDLRELDAWATDHGGVERRAVGRSDSSHPGLPGPSRCLTPSPAASQRLTMPSSIRCNVEWNSHHRGGAKRSHHSQLRAKLREVRTELMRRRDQPIPEQGQWLRSVVRGHCNYYAVPGNGDAVSAFRDQAARHWRMALRRRSQRTSLTWERTARLKARWLPPIQIQHPWPSVRFDARTLGRSPVR